MLLMLQWTDSFLIRLHAGQGDCIEVLNLQQSLEITVVCTGY